MLWRGLGLFVVGYTSTSETDIVEYHALFLINLNSMGMNDEKSNPANWDRVTILVADDNYTCFILVKEILSQTKVKLIYVDNGFKAVKICYTQTVDLVIMDLRMPVLDGYNATIQIKKFLPQIPIIAVSACAMKTDIIRSKETGFDDYLAKPIEIDILLNKIACLLHLEKANWY